MRLIKNLVPFLVFVALATSSSLHAQMIALKTNFLYGATATPNLGIEVGLGKQTTFELAGGLNWFTFVDNKKDRNLLVLPELRYWFCERFNGHFVGIHGHGGQYNVGNWDIPVGRLSAFKDNRYQGYLIGGGINYGYQWLLSPHWSIESTIGAGYANIHYEQYLCPTCGTRTNDGEYHYWGLTKAGISLIYFLK